MKQWNAGLWIVVVAVSAVTAAGCTAIRRENTLQTERTLSAAGFQMKFADDPGRLAETKAIQPQRSLVPQNMDGEPRFVYADAEFCKCVYVGTEKAYQRYQRLALAQKLSQNRLAAAEAEQSASMNWGMWGGWGPWW